MLKTVISIRLANQLNYFEQSNYLLIFDKYYSFKFPLFETKSGLAGIQLRTKRMKKLVPDIINKLNIENVKYDVHQFDSGAVMVDIYIKDKFYVIQIFENEIGLSLNTEDTGWFDVFPNRSFKDKLEFQKAFEEIFI